MAIAKSVCECRVCGCQIQAGDVASLHDVGKHSYTVCLNCCSHIDPARMVKFLEAMLLYNGGEHGSMDLDDFRALRDVFGEFDPFAPPLLLGGKYLAPLWLRHLYN